MDIFFQILIMFIILWVGVLMIARSGGGIDWDDIKGSFGVVLTLVLIFNGLHYLIKDVAYPSIKNRISNVDEGDAESVKVRWNELHEEEYPEYPKIVYKEKDFQIWQMSSTTFERYPKLMVEGPGGSLWKSVPTSYMNPHLSKSE